MDPDYVFKIAQHLEIFSRNLLRINQVPSGEFGQKGTSQLQRPTKCDRSLSTEKNRCPFPIMLPFSPIVRGINVHVRLLVSFMHYFANLSLKILS